LVEISEGKPLHTRRGFLGNQLVEEVVLAGVDGGDLEGDIRGSDANRGGEAELCGSHLSDMKHVFIPEQKDSASSANCGPLSKTL
jgi:hypothetical protein